MADDCEHCSRELVMGTCPRCAREDRIIFRIVLTALCLADVWLFWPTILSLL